MYVELHVSGVAGELCVFGGGRGGVVGESSRTRTRGSTKGPEAEGLLRSPLSCWTPGVDAPFRGIGEPSWGRYSLKIRKGNKVS